MFLDIAGFTAWSSEREPSQVFKLLENLYNAFDGVARHLGVFKVETIGDCYVAVAGLPKPRKDHAVGTLNSDYLHDRI
jgi:class 3 adenylate cyclase